MRSYLTITEPQAREESKLPTPMSMTAVSHTVRDGKREKKKIQQGRLLNSSQRWRWAGYVMYQTFQEKKKYTERLLLL